MNALLNSLTKDSFKHAIELLKEEQLRKDYIERFPDIPQMIDIWSTESYHPLTLLLIDLIQIYSITKPFLNSFALFYKKKDGKVLEALVKICPKECFHLFDFSSKVDVFQWLGVWVNFIEFGDSDVRKGVLESKCFPIPSLIHKMKEKVKDLKSILTLYNYRV